MRFSYTIKIICPVGLVLFLSSSLHAQLTIIEKNKTYWQEVQADSLQKMDELHSRAPGLVYDLRYARPDNFTREKLYKSGTRTFLRHDAAVALAKLQQSLNAQGLGLKIFDAYRPYQVTKKMWELVHDERYVADPAKGSGHNRGLAVDLTLIDLKTRKELDMGTGFDNFTDSAHHDFKDLPPQVLRNRQLLKSNMEAAGFKALDTEWWHYSWPNNRNYAVLDISFSSLLKH